MAEEETRKEAEEEKEVKAEEEMEVEVGSIRQAAVVPAVVPAGVLLPV